MTDNSSYGRLQSWAVRSLTCPSSCNPKLVWRKEKGLTITSAVGGGLRSSSPFAKKPKSQTPPKTTVFWPLSRVCVCVCVLLKCLSLAIPLPVLVKWPLFITQHLTVHLCSVFVFTVFMRWCHFRQLFSPPRGSKETEFLVLACCCCCCCFLYSCLDSTCDYSILVNLF